MEYTGVQYSRAYTHVYVVIVHDNVMYTYMYILIHTARYVHGCHACYICMRNSKQSKGKHSSRHLISEKRAAFSIHVHVRVHTLCIMHVRTCSTQVCVHNTSRTQCACYSVKSVCTCNSCLMVFTVYEICTARGLYVLPRAELEEVHTAQGRYISHAL